MKEEKKQVGRNSAVELLRVIAMVLIVSHHFAIHGGFTWDAGVFTPLRFWYMVLYMGGKVGANCFVLVSGYYLSASREPLRLRKLLKLWGQVAFYAIGIYAVSCILDPGSFGLFGLLKAMLPITFETWWFASAYFVMYLLHPYLNLLLQKLSKRQFQSLLLLLIVIWSVIPSLTTVTFQGNFLTWFLTLYVVAAYVRHFGIHPGWRSGRHLAAALVLTALTYAGSAVSILLGLRWNTLAMLSTYVFGMDKVTTLAISVALLLTFVTAKPFCSPVIDKLASAAFGVYLIHDHETVREFLWLHLFRNAQFQDSWLLIPYSLMVIAAVCIVCFAIDCLQQLLQKRYLRLTDRLADSWQQRSAGIRSLFSRCILGDDGADT